jgi:hypothetical protein
MKNRVLCRDGEIGISARFITTYIVFDFDNLCLDGGGVTCRFWRPKKKGDWAQGWLDSYGAAILKWRSVNVTVEE